MDEKAIVKIKKIEIEIVEEEPPLLYDLTALQIEASRRYGLTAKETLDCAQKLYEGQLLTYPRTSSHYITSEMEQTVSSLLSGADGAVNRLVNADGVSDHTALLPTKNKALVDIDKLDLKPNDKKILDLVYQNLEEATSGPYKYEKTLVTLSLGEEEFTATGIRNKELGWKKNRPDETMEHLLPDFQEGESVDIESVFLEKRQSEPPDSFTDGKLLQAMEEAGAASSENDGTHTGIGTSATRAKTIEDLVSGGFAKRVGEDGQPKRLVPTELAYLLYRALPDSLKSAELTVEWEAKLSEVEKGSLKPEVFLKQVKDFTRTIISGPAEKKKPSESKTSEIRLSNTGKTPSGRDFTDEEKGICDYFRGDIYSQNETFEQLFAEETQPLIETHSAMTCGLDENLDGSIEDNSAYSDKLSDAQKECFDKLKEIRANVPEITADTVMQKVLRPDQFEEYIKDNDYETQITGCATRAADAAPYTNNIEQAYETLRMDYNGTPFKEIVENGGDMYVMRFTSDYCPSNGDYPKMDGSQPWNKPPCTGTGFTGSANHLVPEYTYGKYGHEITDGAIFKVDSSGHETMVAWWNRDHFEPIN